MDREREFIKNTKPQKNLLLWGLLVMLACISLEYWAYKHLQGIKDNPTLMSEVTEEGEYVCVVVESMTDFFASSTDGKEGEKKIYFLFDSEYLYTANLREKELKKLEKILEYSYDTERTTEPEPVKICGTTKYIDIKLKDLAIDSYNEIFNTDFLTYENFEKYVTNYYIDTASKVDDDFLWQSVLIGIFFCLGILLIYYYVKNAKNIKQTLSQYSHDLEVIKNEAISLNSLYEKKARIYLTENYIINLAKGLEIIDYKEVIWVYPHESRQNGYITQKSICVVTKDTKVHVIAVLSANKKNIAVCDKIYDILKQKVANAIQGYSDENREKAKDLFKNK